MNIIRIKLILSLSDINQIRSPMVAQLPNTKRIKNLQYSFHNNNLYVNVKAIINWFTEYNFSFLIIQYSLMHDFRLHILYCVYMYLNKL